MKADLLQPVLSRLNTHSIGIHNGRSELHLRRPRVDTKGEAELPKDHDSISGNSSSPSAPSAYSKDNHEQDSSIETVRDMSHTLTERQEHSERRRQLEVDNENMRQIGSNLMESRPEGLQQHRQPKPTKKSHQQSCLLLTRLPWDLVLSICDCLPHSAVNSLTLTCHTMMRFLKGYSHMNQINSIPVERLDFLKALQRDIPHLHLCHYCQKFHSKPSGPRVKEPHYQSDLDRTMWDYEFPVPRACFHSSGLEGDENMLVMHLLITNNKWYLYGFTFSHLQLAMGRHFGGASQGIPLSELSLSTGYEVARRRGFIFRRSMDADEKVYEKHDIRAAIFEDKLYIHHRQSFSFEKNLADLAEWWINRGRNSLTMNVCKHVGYAPNLLTSYDTLRDTVLDLLWREEVTHKENERHPRNCFRKIAGVKSCDSCFTEYQITLVGLGPEKIEIILDAWHMLGRGRKLEDPIWQAMCGEKKSEDDGDLKDTPIMRERVPGSLKAVFENGNAIFDNRSPTEIIRDDEITRLASEEAPNDTSQEIRKKKTSKFTNRRRKAGQQHHTMGEEQAATLNGGEFSGDLNAHNQGRRSEAGADELVVQWERKPLKPKRD